jgi:hypothetical protein
VSTIGKSVSQRNVTFKKRLESMNKDKFLAVGINVWHPTGKHVKNLKIAYVENEALVYLRAKELIIQLGHCKADPIREAEVDAAVELSGTENLLLKFVIY